MYFPRNTRTTSLPSSRLNLCPFQYTVKTFFKLFGWRFAQDSPKALPFAASLSAFVVALDVRKLKLNSLDPWIPTLKPEAGLTQHRKIPRCGHIVWGQTPRGSVNITETHQPANGSMGIHMHPTSVFALTKCPNYLCGFDARFGNFNYCKASV